VAEEKGIHIVCKYSNEVKAGDYVIIKNIKKKIQPPMI